MKGLLGGGVTTTLTFAVAGVITKLAIIDNPNIKFRLEMSPFFSFTCPQDVPLMFKKHTKISKIFPS